MSFEFHWSLPAGFQCLWIVYQFIFTGFSKQIFCCQMFWKYVQKRIELWNFGVVSANESDRVTWRIEHPRPRHSPVSEPLNSRMGSRTVIQGSTNFRCPLFTRGFRRNVVVFPCAQTEPNVGRTQNMNVMPFRHRRGHGFSLFSSVPPDRCRYCAWK